jgi:multiple antibiotic resistance protein
MLFWKSFLVALTALLPLINPLGSALVFLGLVGEAPAEVYRKLARQVAISTAAFLIAIEFTGSAVLRFFGISLPVLQVTGGLVIAATAWSLLFEKDSNAHAQGRQLEIKDSRGQNASDPNSNTFYPFTFPITAGPGTLVIMLTLSAHGSSQDWSSRAETLGGIAVASVVLSGCVLVCYGYAPQLIKRISPSSVHGVLRVIAFILMCIGVQILWNGIYALGQLFASKPS